MRTAMEVAQAVSPALAGMLVASVWQGALLTVAAALGLRAVRRVSPEIRTWILTAALALVVLLPVLALEAARGTVPAHAALHVGESWSVALLAVWAVCSLWRGTALVANGVRLWRVARRAVPVGVTGPVAALLNGARRRAVLCVSREVNRPSVTGFVRPRVLLPEGLLETLSAEELQHVVLHEMEHLRRGDDWLNLVQQISLVLLPLNPALVWLDRRLCRERELACDDGVLRATGARRAYAACLVKLAEDSLVRKGLALAISALGTRARESELVGRVRRILAGPEPVAGRPRMPLALGGLCAAALLGAGLMLGSPAWVSFDGGTPMVAQVAEPAPGSLPVLAPARGVTEQFPVRPVMAKAIMPGSMGTARSVAPVRPVAAVAVRRRTARAHAAMLRSAVAPAGSLPVLTRVTAEQRRVTAVPSQPRAHFAVTELEVSQPVYAAVPWQGGWLIVQL